MPPSPEIRITVLGSGTSVGVPTIGCRCKVCLSEDPRDKRLRPSILIRYEGRMVLIDTTPDFRAQALRVGIDRLDAILLTHSHADHIMGLDDVRPFNYHAEGGHSAVTARPRRWATCGGASTTSSTAPPAQSSRAEAGLPRVRRSGLRAFRIAVHCRCRLSHGDGVACGFRFGPAAYLTDHSDIPESPWRS